MNYFLEEKYLMALSNFENTFIEHTKGSVVHEVLRNDIQSYVEYLEKQLQQKEDIINKAKEEIRYLESNCDISSIHSQKLKQILDNKGE